MRFMRSSPIRITLLCLLFPASYGQPAKAQLQTRPAEEWIERLERPGRVAELKIDQVLTLLKVSSGQMVADIGAGTGVFARPLARAVAPGGRVLAVEIDTKLLAYIKERAEQEKIGNIHTVHGEFDDPVLPEHVDLAFIHDVLHHIRNRGLYLKNLVSYLKPEGRVAIIDFDKHHPDAPHRDDPELQITLEQVSGWMRAAGFRLQEEFDLFQDKFFVVFAADR